MHTGADTRRKRQYRTYCGTDTMLVEAIFNVILGDRNSDRFQVRKNYDRTRREFSHIKAGQSVPNYRRDNRAIGGILAYQHKRPTYKDLWWMYYQKELTMK